MDGTQAAFLDFLSEEFLHAPPSDPNFLDTATLAAICNMGDTGMASTSAAALKRPQEGENSQEESDEDEKGPASKKSKGDAARNKANREKARREKMNDRFNELARLIDPGIEPKVDKTSILGDAVKYVQHLNCENHQLKQLNKFLEERVSHHERERGQSLYQKSLAMQGMPAPVQQGSGYAGTSSAPPCPQQQQQYMQGSMAMHRSYADSAGFAGPSGQSNGGLYGPSASMQPTSMHPPMLQQQQPQQQSRGAMMHQPQQQQQMSMMNQEGMLIPDGMQQQFKQEPDPQAHQQHEHALLGQSFCLPMDQQQQEQQQQEHIPQHMSYPAGLKPALAGPHLQPPDGRMAAAGGARSMSPGTLDVQQQQPFWLSASMLDSAQDSLLRPSLA